MATIELTKDNFQQTVESNDLVIIDFWAEWCGPCKSFAPVYEAASDNHDGVVFAKVNTEVEQELAAQFQIRSIPTLMAIKEQIIVFSQAGALPASAFDELLGKIKDLDMNMVREEIAKQNAAGEA